MHDLPDRAPGLTEITSAERADPVSSASGRPTGILVSFTWMDFVTTLATAAVTAVLVIALGRLAFWVVARYWSRGATLRRAVRAPFRVFALVCAAAVAARRTPAGAEEWWSVVQHGCRIALIAASAWLIGAILLYLEDISLRRHRIDVPDNRTARRLRTQVLLLRRLTVAAVLLVAIGAILFTFPAVRVAGASVLASAGVISIVAGLAAQSSLANVFAGLTITFSDALRIDDAVIVEGEWGQVEEITLTYVVVRLWDDRRLILPSTYFTQTPFENWTRHTSELLGAVELDLDWRVDVPALRAELDAILERCELWDGRVKVLQTTDAVGGLIRIRVLVTAKDAPTLFDLRCHVREELVSWLQRRQPDALPRQRMELVEGSARRQRRPRSTAPTGLFTGDAEAEERAARAGGAAGREEDPPAR